VHPDGRGGAAPLMLPLGRTASRSVLTQPAIRDCVPGIALRAPPNNAIKPPFAVENNFSPAKLTAYCRLRYAKGENP